MQFLTLVLALLLISAMVHRLGARQAVRLGGRSKGALHSLPSYYGYYVALWCGVPALILAAGWMIFSPMVLKSVVMDSLPQETLSLPAARLSLLMNEVKQMAASGDYRYASDDVARAAAERYHGLRTISFAAMTVAALSAALIGAWWGLRRVSPKLRARNAVEGMVTLFLIASSTVAIFTTIGIVLSLLFESLRFFAKVPITDFLFGLHWSPQTAIRTDQVGSSGAFGAVPLFTGTLLISVIAMVVAVPIGLLSAIYMAEYAHPKFRAVAKPLLEILAGIPTVVYGFFAVLTVAPALRSLGATAGFNISAESALSTGIVMGVMIIPLISSLSDDVISAVPDALRHGSYGLGATHSETIREVVLPAALPGIVGGVLLAVSRAIGETMIVVMAAGLSAHLTANPFQSVTTVTVQIVTLMVGDQEFDSPKTLSAFALGLVLFCVTLALNVVALNVVRKYRKSMTELSTPQSAKSKIGIGSDAEKRLKARYRAEKRFRAYGLFSIGIALFFLAVLLTSIVSRGWSAFTMAYIQLPVTFDAETIDPDGTREHSALSSADYRAVIGAALEKKFPEIADSRTGKRDLQKMVSQGAELEIRKMVLDNPAIIGTSQDLWLPASSPVDQVMKGNSAHDVSSGLSEVALAKLDEMVASGALKRRFNTYLFTNGDSRQPELAGLIGAVVGSFYSLAITLILSFPLGVAAAVYLEEFASKNRWTDLIEVNINNLAAVPSIVFGLLALEIFLNLMGLPRSTPLVGGLALTLVSLPTIIISARVALKAVPPWIREAAQGLGASRQQMVMHHVLPLAMPGILTGTIIAMARAIGESAPLLMIGMVAFVVDTPATPVDPATALPVQVYLWAASSERAFVERTSAAIIVLLVCLAAMNATAIYLRKKFERRW